MQDHGAAFTQVLVIVIEQEGNVRIAAALCQLRGNRRQGAALAMAVGRAGGTRFIHSISRNISKSF
jgi:hypothetical protein